MTDEKIIPGVKAMRLDGSVTDTPIEPALTPEEWKTLPASAWDMVAEEWVLLSDHVKIALLNAALPDDDPRKITWGMVNCHPNKIVAPLLPFT